MSAIVIAWDNATGRGTFAVDEAGALALGPDVVGAVYVSVFSDRRALPDDKLTDGTDDRRGWWADAYEDKPHGSRLWLLDRARREPETLRRAKDYIAESLAWMVEDGVAARVEVETEWHPKARNMLAARVVISRTDGARVPVAFEWAWQGV